MDFLQKITGDAPVGIPKATPDRVCQADADIFAYLCCSSDDPLSENVDTLKLYIEQQRIMAGAVHINLHLTMGKKAGRYEAATVKPYQENRTDRDPLQQARVWELRRWMSEYKTATVTPIPWTDREADDGMSMLQRDIIEENGIELSIIMTMDKDLRMVPGYHMHPNTYETTLAPDGYGSCSICEKTATKKVVGWGTSFFWHQMLMGDTADNIPGLPKVSAGDANEFKPTKVFNPNRKALACGPMLAYACLSGITDEHTAIKRVIRLYKGYYGSEWSERFYEQAKLLWMMRNDNFDDYKEYIKEVMHGQRN